MLELRRSRVGKLVTPVCTASPVGPKASRPCPETRKINSAASGPDPESNKLFRFRCNPTRPKLTDNSRPGLGPGTPGHCLEAAEPNPDPPILFLGAPNPVRGAPRFGPDASAPSPGRPTQYESLTSHDMTLNANVNACNLRRRCKATNRLSILHHNRNHRVIKKRMRQTKRCENLKCLWPLT